ncbi:hypothetical protein GCM10023152_12420 [Agromyces bauzanensis]|uniref:Uncharacterized protein n=1 Tax=Agromyces bauzanensis TaxID=1308924 RepID=A0A917P8H7_9MICO|nr:hypothetical protein GCM10011372_00510 [Agromyces bauzanensis]
MQDLSVKERRGVVEERFRQAGRHQEQAQVRLGPRLGADAHERQRPRQLSGSPSPTPPRREPLQVGGRAERGLPLPARSCSRDDRSPTATRSGTPSTVASWHHTSAGETTGSPRCNLIGITPASSWPETPSDRARSTPAGAVTWRSTPFDGNGGPYSPGCGFVAERLTPT